LSKTDYFRDEKQPCYKFAFFVIYIKILYKYLTKSNYYVSLINPVYFQGGGPNEDW